MASIPASQARAQFTQQLVALWNEKVAVNSFLRSLTQEKRVTSKYVSIEVRRGGQKVAVDVLRGTEGTAVSKSRSTEKIFEPPFYKQRFFHNELEYYDRVFAATSDVAPQSMAELLNEVADKYSELRAMQERRYELQVSQVLSTGIVTTNSGNIDFKRNANSLVTNGVADKWTAATAKIKDQLNAGMNFIRQTGKSASGVCNIIMGESAILALYANERMQKELDLKSVSLDELKTPQANAAGGILHGSISFGSYKGYVWTYPDFYEDPANGNASTAFVPANEVWMIPTDAEIVMAFAGVPQVIKFADQSGMLPGIISNQSGYVASNFLDERQASHEFSLASAGLVIPVSVDKIYTMKVL